MAGYVANALATRVGFIKTTKEKRKTLPPELTNEEIKIFTKIKRRAYQLNVYLFNCCGTRFG
jgi:hypothetical protein